MIQNFLLKAYSKMLDCLYVYCNLICWISENMGDPCSPVGDLEKTNDLCSKAGAVTY
jgi:hypothetical protein